jgi:hypothetical protein
MTLPPFADHDLEDALRDLGQHIDLGRRATPIGQADLVTAVLARIENLDQQTLSTVSPRHGYRQRFNRRHPRVLVAAVAVVVVLTAVLAITPTRHAVARWFGIGAVRITQTDSTLPTVSESTEPSISAPSTSFDLDTVARALPFRVRVPDPALAGAPIAATVDPAVPSGLIEIRYDEFTLVELASQTGLPPVVEKLLGPGTTTETVTVEGRPGVWISGAPHQVASIDPNGNFTIDTVRRAGNVLLWEDDAVTYRIEGLPSLDAALAIAASLH